MLQTAIEASEMPGGDAAPLYAALALLKPGRRAEPRLSGLAKARQTGWTTVLQVLRVAAATGSNPGLKRRHAPGQTAASRL
jgi:hypothetical protein